MFAFVVCVCVFSCLSGSGRDGDAHAYRSSDSEHFVLNIVVFLLVIVRRMRLCGVVSLCFCLCCLWGLGSNRGGHVQHRLQSGEISECV